MSEVCREFSVYVINGSFHIFPSSSFTIIPPLEANKHLKKALLNDPKTDQRGQDVVAMGPILGRLIQIFLNFTREREVNDIERFLWMLGMLALNEEVIVCFKYIKSAFA